MSRTLARRPVPIALWLLAGFLLLTTGGLDANARPRFVEGDWIVWGDARFVNDIHEGRETIYIATRGGIHRWHKYDRTWQFPWYSVPGDFDKAVILSSAMIVREDPFSRDVYVYASDSWYRRSYTRETWEEIDPPSDQKRQELGLSDRPTASSPRGLIMPFRYYLTDDGDLEYRFVTWDYNLGRTTEFQTFYAWRGFGLGMVPTHDMKLTLYPGGPAASPNMDVRNGQIWCVNNLDHDLGWVWKRDRDSEAWEFFHPEIVYSLQSAKVNRLRIGPRDDVWLATDEGVMYYKNDDWRWLKKADGLPSRVIHDIVPYGNGAWVATHFGLGEIDYETGVTTTPDKKLFPEAHGGLFEVLATDGDTLYAAGNGLILKRGPDGIFNRIPTPRTIGATEIPTALYAEDGVLAIGDSRGFAWRKGDGDWHSVFSNRWFSGTVLSIVQHSDRWFLGTDRGLVMYEPSTNKIVRYTEKEGLIGQHVHEVIPEGDWLWLGTNRALVRFRWYREGAVD